MCNHGKLRGYNTDSYGFVQGLKEASFDASGASVLIIGAGGAARGVALALANMDVRAIAIANRTLERAQRLADEIGVMVPHLRVLSLNDDALRAEALRSDLIVSCTSLGMWHSPQEAITPLRAEHIPQEALAYDLVYNPPETPFILEAKRAGARTMGGLTMLVHQGVASLKLWTGRDAPVEVMMKAAESALAGR